MDEIDERVTVVDVTKFLAKERQTAEKAQKKEKDEENLAYFSGQLDLLDRVEAFIAR